MLRINTGNIKTVLTATAAMLLFFSLFTGPERSGAQSIMSFPQNKPEVETEIVPKLYGASKKTMLAPGVEFRRYRFKVEDSYIMANVVIADVSSPEYKLEVMKAGNNTSDVERLHTMINDYDSTHKFFMLAAVNGSFWKAYTNYPMGPTLIDGEIVELKNVMKWNSAFIDGNGKLYIDGFETSCRISNRDSLIYTSYYVNRRDDSAGVAIYNSYAGDRVPYISQRKIDKMLKDALKDKKYKDISESQFDSVKLRQELYRIKRNSDFDYYFPKISLRYLGKPAMNREFRAVVTASQKSGSMFIPSNGIVMTFGIGANRKLIPSIGDTVTLRYSTNQMSNTVFYHGLCGTPRLVRDGRIIVEAPRETSKSKRFVKGDLRRTAIGTSRDKSKIYLVTTEGSNGRGKLLGADLKQLAYIMRRIGAYDALNLDGGGSTTMVIDGSNIMNSRCPECSRSLSVGIGIARRKLSIKSIFDKFK